DLRRARTGRDPGRQGRIGAVRDHGDRPQDRRYRPLAQHQGRRRGALRRRRPARRRPPDGARLQVRRDPPPHHARHAARLSRANRGPVGFGHRRPDSTARPDRIRENPMTVTPNSTAARDVAYHLHPYTNAVKQEAEGPTVLARGKGIYVYDEDGKEYLE